jgi:RNA polymerase sigma-70 factor (ECF subfamily)
MRDRKRFVVTRAGGGRSYRVDPERERELVERLRRGEHAAFDALYDAYRAKIFGFLARLTGRRDLAEDLLQETFLRLAARATQLVEDTHLGPWLFTVARHLYWSHCRSTVLDAARLDALALAPPPTHAPSPFESAAASQLGARLERAFAALPERDREVLLLVSVERLDHADAASVLELSPEALRQRLSRARARLEDALAEPSVAARVQKRSR